MLSKKIIETILKEDAESYDEGIVLYSDDGYLSRGAKSLTIRSFVDLVVSVCSRMAKNIYMKKTPLLSEYAKVFVQTFLENSAMNRSNRTWRKTFADNLTKELENVERLVIKYR
jgi:hypothetical protein